MSNPELQALLANLRPRSQASVSNLSRDRSREPSTSFLTTSHVPSTPPPPFSPVPLQKSPAPSTSAVAQNLLNLLNFHQSTPSPALRPHEDRSQSLNPATIPTRQGQENHTATTEHKTEPSTVVQAQNSPIPNQQASRIESQSEPLLNEAATIKSHITAAQPPRTRSTSSGETIGEGIEASRSMVHSLVGKAQEEHSAKQDQAMQTGQNKPLFTYKNPFEALKASRTNNTAATHTISQPAQQQTVFSPPDIENISFAPPEVHSTLQATNETATDRVKLMPKSRTPKSNPQQQQDVTEIPSDAKPEPQASDHKRDEESAITNITDVVKCDIQDDHIILDQPEEQARGTKSVEHGTTGSRIVPVLSFPVRAFVSITLQPGSTSNITIREEGVMEISRLKKEFDQIDRSLAVASSKYIAYAFVKNGGMRIIRQDDGSDRHVFKNSHDRIFNIALSTTSTSAAPLEHQAVLGTGVSGAVYYATICRSGRDMFDTNQLTAESLVFPAHPQADENTAGGILKTRAKRSSSHPEFFAIGRGKAIHIIWPATVLSSRYGVVNEHRTVDVEKLFQERPLQILTGKAGKDFTFSEDDTMIVSLDKTGRLRFWDVRKLVDEENAKSVQISPYTIDTPVLSLSTASPAEKSWPTSVLFVDKARPYTRGGPLRYVLVGLRQNHTLQLWDIALGKAVQEISFPHENETDGICSVSYHPASGIIAVGHPTRNSVFFIHLSAPRYTLSCSISQASYVQRIASKDPEIPKPESTACMSGIREISFGTRGQIRSVELLPVYKQSDNTTTSTESEILFELYIVHSKGVTCLTINREDLGWNADNKIVHAIDAEKEGLVALKELKLGSVIEESSESKAPGPEPASQAKSSKKKSKKSKEVADEPTHVIGMDTVQNNSDIGLVQTSDPVPTSEIVSAKQPKKTKKPSVSDDFANKTEQLVSRSIDPTGHSDQFAVLTNGKVDTLIPVSNPIAANNPPDNDRTTIRKTVTAEIRKELEQLYQNIKSDRTLQDEVSSSRQEAMLRLVSITLDNNVEKSLARIIASQMSEVVVPSVTQSISDTIVKHITDAVAESIPRELTSMLPLHLELTLQSPQMLMGIGNNITQRLTAQIQGEITKTVNNSIASNMKTIATRAANEVFSGYESRIAEQFRDLQIENKSQSDRLALVNQNMEAVLTSIQTMAQVQADLTEQMREQLSLLQAHSNSQTPHQSISTNPGVSTGSMSAVVDSNSRTTESNSSVSKHVSARPQHTQADIDLGEISYLMEQQRYEEGSIKWLQSSAPHEIFDSLFVRYTPDYLATDVSSLVAFSIGVTLANELATNTQQRLEWILAAFNTVDLQDREIIELSQHAPQLIDGVVAKLEAMYLQKSKIDSRNTILSSIRVVAKKAQELKHIFDVMNNT